MVYIEEYGEFREFTGKEFAIERVSSKKRLDEIADMVRYLDRNKLANDILSLLEEQSWLSAREIQYTLGTQYPRIVEQLTRLYGFGLIVFRHYNGGVFSNFQYVKKWRLNI